MRRDEGATTVEFALVFPVFIMVLGIGAYFGWYVYVHAQLERAATRAARFAAVPTTAGAYSFCPGSVLQTVNANLVSEQASSAEVTVQDSAGALAASATCPAVPRGYVRVTVSHTFTNPFTSLVATITPLSGTVTVTGSGQATVETP